MFLRCEVNEFCVCRHFCDGFLPLFLCLSSFVHATQLQLERDELYETFDQSVHKVQHKGEVKSALLERKLTALTDRLEETQAQLCSVLSASNIDQTALSGITDKVEVLLFIIVVFICCQSFKRLHLLSLLSFIFVEFCHNACCSTEPNQNFVLLAEKS